MSEHVEDRIAAYLDGELSETESAAVRAHVDSCVTCTKAMRDSEAALRMLDSDEAAQPLASMWPEVESRLGRRLPIFDLPFATASAVALTAGVMMGVLMFDHRVQPVGAGGEVVATTDGWSTDGEVLLADVYLSVPDATETETP